MRDKYRIISLNEVVNSEKGLDIAFIDGNRNMHIVTSADQKRQKWEIEYFELNTYSLYTHNNEYFQQVL